jgi:ATP-binding cassette subfamily B protein
MAAIPPVAIEEVFTKAYDPQLARRLLGFIRPYRWPFSFAMLLMLTGAAMTIIGPYLVKVALDSGIAGSLPDYSEQCYSTCVAVVQWIVTYARVNIMARVGQSIIFDLRARLFEHLQELSLNFFSHYSRSSLRGDQ